MPATEKSFAETTRYDGRKITAVALAFFILNIVLKIIFLDHNDIALDEPFTLFHSQKTLSGIFDLLKDENNPPLYFILMKGWTSLFGIGAFAARFPSLLFSAVSAVIIFFTGIRFWNFRTGCVASAIYSFSTFHMFYAHDARVYSLFFLLACLSFYFFLSLYSTPDSKGSLLWLIAINCLLLYAHFFGIIAIASQVACVLLLRTFRVTLLKPMALCTGALFLFFLPYLPVLFHRFQASTNNSSWIQSPIGSDLYTMVWRFSNAPVTTVLFLTLLFILVVGLITKKIPVTKSTPEHTKAVLLLFILPYLSTFLISFHIPVFLDRYLIFLSLFYYLAVAVAADLLAPKNKAGWLILFVPVALMVFTMKLNPDKKRNVRELVETIRPVMNAKTAIYIYPEWFDLNFVYYYRPEWFREPGRTKLKLAEAGIFPVLNKQQIDTSQLKSFHEVYLIDASGSPGAENNPIAPTLQFFFPEKDISEIYEHLYLIHFTRPE